MTTGRALEGEILVEQLGGTEGDLQEAAPFASGWRLRLMRLALLATILVLWEVAAGNPRQGEFALIDKFWVSQPSDIWARFVGWVERGTLAFHLAITLQEMATGFVIGSVIGALTG